MEPNVGNGQQNSQPNMAGQSFGAQRPPMQNTATGGGVYSSQPTAPITSTPQLTTPVYSSGQDIVLQTSNGGHKKWPWIVVFAIVLIAAIGGGLVFLLSSSQKSQEIEPLDGYVHDLMEDSYSKINNIQQTFVEARDGEYSSEGLFSEDAKNYINEMGVTMENFYNEVSAIDLSRITVPLAKENLERLKANLDQNISAYTNTVDLYNQYYDDGTYTDETTVQDIFSIYTDNEEFTSIYYYEIIGDLIAELQNAEEE